MTKFNEVLSSVEKYQSNSPWAAQLILLDYFAPWTLR